ncbi:MAG TPA: diguanylate cyclase [Ramlibacter sp.]|uniref:diguanylate cyclase domain-containing protein n=1 Tax=Ramlibacter sp. TaxID=1917967 RepID=UPI002BD775E5|nr:diguanylate cyclase [Ramlibacter sp.]HVZ44633.1 diguanylate cyclase [Ramlibacter sp.]
MTAIELMIWSMALGAIAAVGIARAADAGMRPSLSQLRAVGYHLAVFLLVLVESGALKEALSATRQQFLVVQVLAGPACVALSNLWVQRWLAAHQRDRAMLIGLRASALVLSLAGLGALALPAHEQLAFAVTLALGGNMVTLWATVRATLLGDRLAPVMGTGCALTLAAIAGLYAVAMDGEDLSAAAHAAIAFCAAAANAITGLALWRRDRQEREAHSLDAGATGFDPVTRLATGTELVRRIVVALKRRARTKRQGAVLAIMVFDLELLARQIGTAGVNEMFVVLAGRIQRQVGVVNPVGRYWDRCFVALLESIQSPGWLRTLGLRVSASLRRPIEVTGLGGARVQVRLEAGIGIVHLSTRPAAVEDILHDAERMAEAARRMPSRAAIMDRRTGQPVPVEAAPLGPRSNRYGREVPQPLPTPARSSAESGA